jgi:phage terminase large subunit-like protein
MNCSAEGMTMISTVSIHPTTAYAIEVIERKRVAGHTETLACQRHLFDLARAGQLGKLAARVRKTFKNLPEKDTKYPYIFDEDKADRIIRWFALRCNHVEGPLAGKPIELLPFQKFDLGSIFGWVDKDTGYRRFEKAYIQEARKNGKTATLAGVANYMMVGDGEMSPSVYCAAVDRGQARLMYEAAMSMARSNRKTAKQLKIRDYKVSHVARGGRMIALSKDTRNKDGLNPSGAIIDEYHAHTTSEIYDLISSAWGQRAQALMVIITTAGMDVQGPCYREYEYCKQILREETTNERYFVMIREMDRGDDEHDPKNWIKANPLRAATPGGLKRLQQQHDEAFDSHDPAKVRTFRVKNLNIWVHGDEDSFMSEVPNWREKWDSLAISKKEFDELTKDRLCLVGVDLSKKIDLTGDGFVFALPDGRIAITAHGFMPEQGVIRHEQTDKIPYRDWALQGWLTITDGEVTDYSMVQAHIQDMEVEKGWSVYQLGYDPYNGTHFANEMSDLGYTCYEVRQGVQTLSEPTKQFREWVAQGKIVHDGSPLLTWCLANAKQVADNNENIKLSKKYANDTRRIDLLAAVIDALVQYQALVEQENSVYNTRGIITIGG